MDDRISFIIHTIRNHYPDVQGIYLFGSYGTESEGQCSDIDIALLLPVSRSENGESLFISQCRFDLENTLHRDIDLVNIRRVSTVFQKEIIGAGNLIYCADPYAVDEFEMLVISYYQKLNEERKEILESFMKTGRAYAV